MSVAPAQLVCLLVAAALALWPGTSIGAVGSAPTLDWVLMVTGTGGGLALFLFGMDQVTDVLKAAAGGRLQRVLGRLTTNRISGALVGALVTAVIQSSSVTTVMVVGFVSAGLMTLSQSIGVIMGANVGTTITAQIIAFKVTRVALVLVGVGFFTLFFSRRELFRFYGGILFGLGLVFFGMSVMSDSMAPLREYRPFLELMVRMESPYLGLLIGALFTALVQSSSATTAIVIVLAGQGFVSLPAGILLALGANVGTCVTAMLAAVGKPRVALRAAAVHVLFNVAGVLLWIGLVDTLAMLSIWMSPAYPGLIGGARVAAEVPRQIANANTLFNLVNTVVFLSFAPLFGRTVTRLFPDRADHPGTPIMTPKYLDDLLLETPSAALDVARKEVGQLGYQVLLMMTIFETSLEKRSEGLLNEIEKADDQADILHSAIMTYLNQLGKQKLTEAQAGEYYRLTQAADTLDGIGDILEADLSGLGRRMLRIQPEPSPEMRAILMRLMKETKVGVESAINAVVYNREKAAQEVLGLRQTVNDLVESAFRQQSMSLARNDVGRLNTLKLEFEVTDRLKQVYSLSKRIARLYVPREV